MEKEEKEKSLNGSVKQAGQSTTIIKQSFHDLRRIRGQFHQHSTRSFYIRKLRAQLFCTYILGLYFTGVSLPAQKLRVERW